MSEPIRLEYTVPGDDFARAGEASADLKATLKKLGLPAAAVRRISIALYEGEINLAIHAGGGNIDVAIGDNDVEMVLSDHGPGIPDRRAFPPPAPRCAAWASGRAWACPT